MSLPLAIGGDGALKLLISALTGKVGSNRSVSVSRDQNLTTSVVRLPTLAAVGLVRRCWSSDV